MDPFSKASILDKRHGDNDQGQNVGLGGGDPALGSAYEGIEVD